MPESDDGKIMKETIIKNDSYIVKPGKYIIYYVWSFIRAFLFFTTVSNEQETRLSKGPDFSNEQMIM